MFDLPCPVIRAYVVPHIHCIKCLCDMYLYYYFIDMVRLVMVKWDRLRVVPVRHSWRTKEYGTLPVERSTRSS